MTPALRVISQLALLKAMREEFAQMGATALDPWQGEPTGQWSAPFPIGAVTVRGGNLVPNDEMANAMTDVGLSVGVIWFDDDWVCHVAFEDEVDAVTFRLKFS